MQINAGLKVGLITANYNNGKYFKEYWGGILCQTTKPDYVVFCDDCSNDDSVNHVLAYFGNKAVTTIDENTIQIVDQGIKFVLIRRKVNGGPGTARNDCLRFLHNKVDIIGVYDSDDIYYKGKVEESVKVFKKYGQVGLVYSDYEVLKQSTQVKGREYKEIFSQLKLQQECIVSNNSFFLLKLAEKVGLYDEDPEVRGPEDFQLWLLLSTISAVYHIAKSLYAYRVHDTNLTVATSHEILNKRHYKMRQNLQQRIEAMKNV